MEQFPWLYGRGRDLREYPYLSCGLMDRLLRSYRTSLAICSQLVHVPTEQAPRRPLAHRGLLSAPAMIGFTGSIVVTLASGARGGPFLPSKRSLLWYVTAPHFFRTGLGQAIALAAFFAGVVAVSWAWLQLSRICLTWNVPTASIVGIFCLWAVPLLIASPLCSRDVYAYVAHGELVTRGYDPYKVGASVMGKNDFTNAVDPVWRKTSSMYGPLFLWVSAMAVRVGGHTVSAAVLTLRLLVVCSIGLMIAGCVSLAKRFDRNPAEILALAVLNPVVMVHFIGAIHNDALMMGFLVAGLASAFAGWRAVGIVLCAVAASIKLPAFAGVIVIGWIWHGHRTSLVRKMVDASLAGLAGLATLGIITAILGSSWGWIHGLSIPGKVHPLLAPVNAAALVTGLAFPFTVSVASVFFRTCGFLISIVFATSVILKSREVGSDQSVLRALGWSLLVFALLGPTLFPWYLTWGGILLAIAGPGRLPRVLSALVIGVNLTVLPNGHGLLDTPESWARPVVGLGFVLLCLAVLKIGIARLGSPVEELSDRSLRKDLVKALA